MIRRAAVILFLVAACLPISTHAQVPAAQPQAAEFSCPCWHREAATFSFLMHYNDPITTAGKLLRSGVQQAARDRGLRLHEHYPAQIFSVTEAVQFLEAEIRAGTSGIITTLYNEQIIPPLRVANKAGIPVYVVGGTDAAVLRSLQKEEPSAGPLRASLRNIGLDIFEVGNTLATLLIAAGVTHLRCVITDVGTLLWFSRCRVLVDAFTAKGLSASWHVRSSLSVDLAQFLESVEALEADVPAQNIAVVVMDSNVYENIKGRLWEGSKAGATLVVYETSVGALQDIRDGKHVIALNANYYTQGYLALALAAAELQTGQMVTSDIIATPHFYGAHLEAAPLEFSSSFLPVTDDVMYREVCRAARNPVCGDPGVEPVTPSGCACFNRADVAFKVVSGLPKRLTNTHLMWQGLVDAQRDMPGSTFHWNVYDASSFFQYADYEEVANTTRYRGAICMDSLFTDVSRALGDAIRSVSDAGKPLYLAYSKNSANGVPAFLAEFGARSYVGPDPYVCGLTIGSFVASLGANHTLANNMSPVTPWSWQIMHGVTRGLVGPSYVFPPDVWEWPVLAHGDPANRTGAWALYIAPGSNRTFQVMNGELAGLGTAFVAPLRQRLQTDLPAPDMLVLQMSVEFIGTESLKLLAEIGDEDPARRPVRMVTYECLSVGFLALARLGKLKGEELFMGCVDAQHYLGAYVSATLAALEQHTGETFLGWVNTARLFNASQLPRNFMRRVSCELDGYNRGIVASQLGMFYPVCDARNGCVPGGLDAPRGAEACSGHGSCHFPTEADPSGGTNMLQGACQCEPGWEGQYCQVYYVGRGCISGGLDAPNGTEVCSGHGTCRISVEADPGGQTAPLEGVCECEPGWHGAHCDEIRVEVSESGTSSVLLIVLLTTGCALLLTAALIIYYTVRVRKHADESKAFEEFLHKRGRGDHMAAIVTDIEGSTSLWEWNPSIMNKALVTHHKVLRALLPKYYGYESDTEGDSFTLVFHDAIDALGWAMEVQRQLLFPASLSMEPSGNTPRRVKRRESKSTEEDAHLTDWPPELLEMEVAKEVKDPVDGSVLYRGLRVRMGIHSGVPEACIMHPNGRQRYQGEVVDLTKAIQGAAASGGQVLMSTVAWHSLGLHMRSVVCHHMGMQEVGERLPPVHVMQVLPQELVKRAPFLPLKSRSLWPSFFDAPCASECYLKAEPPKQPVVICFMYVGGASTLRRTPGYQQAVTLLVGFVQSRLSQYEAYECEEKDGNFLLAFRSPIQAAHFAEAVQREAMDLDWPEKLLEQDAAAEVVKMAGDKADGGAKVACVVFRGLRLQIGLCMGIPNDCRPHVATGRAAYFGPVVNRAARIAATAAHGQTLANHEVIESIKGQAVAISFLELGEFGLKGVKELLHLYQISSEALDHRLFPRTLKLAKSFLTTISHEEVGSSDGKNHASSSHTQGSMKRAGDLASTPVSLKVEGSTKKGAHRTSVSVRAIC
eukprot:jgi/Mesvir1/14007/Mv02855-RA.1